MVLSNGANDWPPVTQPFYEPPASRSGVVHWAPGGVIAWGESTSEEVVEAKRISGGGAGLSGDGGGADSHGGLDAAAAGEIIARAQSCCAVSLPAVNPGFDGMRGEFESLHGWS